MSAPAPAKRRLGIYLPLILFAALVLLFLFRLFAGDPQKLPSALIGKPAPMTTLASLPGLPIPGIDSAAVSGKVTVLNVFASWCVPCREEHPALLDLQKSIAGRNIRLVGLNYKDKPDAALAFLKELGNPYSAVGIDPMGRTGIDWGVYGVPETFIIRPDGTIAYKHVGPLTVELLRKVLLPEIAKAGS